MLYSCTHMPTVGIKGSSVCDLESQTIHGMLQAITSDGATIEVGADVYFRVKDAVLSVANVQDLNYATRVLCQTSLQRHISKQNLSDIGSDNVILTDALLVRSLCLLVVFITALHGAAFASECGAQHHRRPLGGGDVGLYHLQIGSEVWVTF